MTSMQVRSVGMCWYLAQDYPRILEIMEDAKKLHKTHDQWLKAAELGERELKRKGHIVVRALIDPEAFTVWCRENGLNRDSNARSTFASCEALQKVKNTH
jgi:hypothetical protein